MQEQYRKKLIAGSVLIALAFALLAAAFFALSRTDAQTVFFRDTPEEHWGWTYEVLENGAVSKVAPDALDPSSGALPGERVDAIRMSRVMAEPLERYIPQLLVSYSGVGLEVALDGVTYYSNMTGGGRDAQGFLQWTEESRTAVSGMGTEVGIILPDDYLGKTLTVTAYYPEPVANPLPVWVGFGSETAVAAQMITESVLNVVFLTIYALAVLLVLALFTVDHPNGRTNARTLLLAAFFLMTFLESAAISLPGGFSPLFQKLNLYFPEQICLATLFLYLALGLQGKKKWVLSGVTALWLAFLLGLWLVNVLNPAQFFPDSEDRVSMALFLALIVCYILDCRTYSKRFSRRQKLAGGATLLLSALVCFLWHAANWGMMSQSVWDTIWTYLCTLGHMLFLDFYYATFMDLVADICSAAAVVFLAVDTLGRRLKAYRTMDMLEERSRIAVTEYERLLSAEEATSAVRHEMRHHMAALSGLLQSGETGRAAEYVAAVQGDLDRLPNMQYSPNMLVNALAGMYLDKAKREGVRVEYALDVPAKVGIADEDLTVLLTNLLENAVQACEKIPAGMEKFIEVRMHVSGSSLFVGCVNSAPPEEEPPAEKRPGHGYGLEAMRRVAEKYDSVLKLDREPGRFSVKTNLALR